MKLYLKVADQFQLMGNLPQTLFPGSVREDVRAAGEGLRRRHGAVRPVRHEQHGRRNRVRLAQLIITIPVLI